MSKVQEKAPRFQPRVQAIGGTEDVSRDECVRSFADHGCRAKLTCGVSASFSTSPRRRRGVYRGRKPSIDPACG